MASLRELRRKIKSIRSTQQITKAMKLVAAARLNRAQERILSARPFSLKLETLLQELAYLASQKEGTDVHPFFEIRSSTRVDMIVFTSDRGLCGSFNINVIRKTLSLISQMKDKAIHLWLVGKKARDYFKRLPYPIEKEYSDFYRNLRFAQAEIIGEDIIRAFLKSDTSKMMLVTNCFKSCLSQEVVVKTILPIAPFPQVKPRLDFIYEPHRKDIFNTLLPWYIKTQIYRYLLESLAAELSARVYAMDNASKNAGEIIASLTLYMNKIRQASITKEILEVVSGAGALQTV